MNEICNETDDIEVELDEFSTFDSNTSGIASASQLVDDTNNIVINENYTT